MMIIVGLLIVGCEALENSSSEVDSATSRPEPRLVFTFVASDRLSSRAPSQTGWPKEDLVLSEYDLVDVDWATRKLVFHVEDSTIVQDLLRSGNSFSISYDGTDLAEGAVHWIVPASGVVNVPALFVIAEPKSDNNLAVEVLENYNYMEPGKTQSLHIADAALDREIGLYLEDILADRPR